MEVQKHLESKKIRLEKIIKSNYPSNPDLIRRHEEKVARATEFLEEMKEVSFLLELKNNVLLVVPLATFTKQLEKADFATIEFDGEFCKIATVQNFPSSNIWLVYIAPVEIC